MRRYQSAWRATGHVSDVCENRRDGLCGAPAVLAYPAMGGGYFAMCSDHARGHEWYSVPIGAAKRGEVPALEHHAPSVGSRERIGADIRRRRIARGWSVEQLAAAAGYAPNTVRVYEYGLASRCGHARLLNALTSSSPVKRSTQDSNTEKVDP